MPTMNARAELGKTLTSVGSTIYANIY